MTASSQIPPIESFPAGEAETVGAYRAPSALAVAGLLVGLVSPVCVFGPLLLIVPFAGIGLALLALQRIDASDGALIGRSLAVAGLVLSVLTVSTYVSQYVVMRQLRSAQAAEVGKQWIALVLAGDTKSAYQLSNGSAPPDPDEPHDFGPEGNPYDRFLERDSVKSLLALDPSVRVQDEGTVRYQVLHEGRYLVQRRYSVDPGPTGAKETATPRKATILLEMIRATVPGMSGMTWRAAPLDEADSSS